MNEKQPKNTRESEIANLPAVKTLKEKYRRQMFSERSRAKRFKAEGILVKLNDPDQILDYLEQEYKRSKSPEIQSVLSQVRDIVERYPQPKLVTASQNTVEDKTDNIEKVTGEEINVLINEFQNLIATMRFYLDQKDIEKLVKTHFAYTSLGAKAQKIMDSMSKDQKSVYDAEFTKIEQSIEEIDPLLISFLLKNGVTEEEIKKGDMEKILKKIRDTKPSAQNESPSEEAQPVVQEINEFEKEDKKYLKTFGLRMEEWKNNFFAGIFTGEYKDAVLKKMRRKKEGEGTKAEMGEEIKVEMGEEIKVEKSAFKRFAAEFGKMFRKQAEEFHEKREQVENGGKGAAKGWMSFGADVVRNGRMVADYLGLTAAIPTRYFMMAMVAAEKGFSAAKGARMGSEETLKSVRKDQKEYAKNAKEWREDQELADAIAKAQDEAFAMNPNAKKAFEKGEDPSKVSKRELKDAYLKALPEELKQRMIAPQAAWLTVQGQAQREISSLLKKLEKKMGQIENSNGNDEEKEKEKINLLRKFEKKLADWDRMLTTTGTINKLAYGLSKSERAAEIAKHVLTVETLLVSAERLAEKLWDVKFGIVDAEKSAVNSVLRGKIFKAWSLAQEQEAATATNESIMTDPGNTTQTPKNIEGDLVMDQKTDTELREKIAAARATAETAPSGNTPSATETILSKVKGVNFDKGKGGIAGIKELREQIKHAYNGDYSSAPKSVQDFMKEPNATKLAIKFGLFKPDIEDESANIMKGSTLKFDANGNLVFHDARENADTVMMEGDKVTEYKGKRFDYDSKKAQALKEQISEKIDGDKRKPWDPSKELEEHMRTKRPEPFPVSKEIDLSILNSTTETPMPKAPDIETADMRGFLSRLTVEEKISFEKDVESMSRDLEISKEEARERIMKTWDAKLNISQRTIPQEVQPGTRSLGTKPADVITGQPGEGVRPYSQPSVRQMIEAERQRANATYRGYNRPFGGWGIWQNSEPEYYPQLSPQENFILQNESSFGKNPFWLSPEELIDVYHVHIGNIQAHLTEPGDMEKWEKMAGMDARNVIKGGTVNENNVYNEMLVYMQRLQKETGLKPKFWGKESVRDYIARALQKAADKNKLELFRGRTIG